MLSDFWRVLLEGRLFFWVKWYTPSISYTIYHTKASSFILKDNTLPCDSSYYLQIQGKAVGASFRWTLCKKVCFNWYRLRLIKIIFWRKLAAVSDNNLFRIFLYTNIWKKNWIFIVMQQIQRFVLYSSNDLNTFLSISRRKRKGQLFDHGGLSSFFFFFLRSIKAFNLTFSVFF